MSDEAVRFITCGYGVQGSRGKVGGAKIKRLSATTRGNFKAGLGIYDHSKSQTRLARSQNAC